MGEDLTRKDGGAAVPAADEIVRVAFANGFFGKLEDAHFRVSEQTGEPVLIVRYAKNEAALPFPGLRRELNITPESPDGRMLDLVARGLRYVKGMRIGDPIPSEVLTGKASWQAGEAFTRLAYQRLSLQLVNWMTGGKSVVPDRDEVPQLAEDDNTKRMVDQAVGAAAQKLGLGRENGAEMARRVRALAEELGYIEALRERLVRVEAIGPKLRALRGQIRGEYRLQEMADQGLRFLRRAVLDFRKRFEETDLLTSAILDALRDLDGRIAAIRAQRDDLHIRLLAWDEIVAAWLRQNTVKASAPTLELVRRTYHFLAPRHMVVSEWVRATETMDPKRAAEGASLLDRSDTYLRQGRVMRW